MNTLTFSYTNSHLLTLKLKEITQRLQTETEHMHNELQQQYATKYASLYAPYDTQTHKKITDLVKIIKTKKPTMLIIIGIGGSNLGTMAVHHALQGTLYNNTQPPCKVYFAETVDSAHIQTLVSFATQELQNNKTVIINIVSKSGTTTETIANASIFIDLLKKYTQKWQESIIATTDKNSKLWNFAHQHTITTLEIPKQIGGRYSVFSAVGLFPLALLGVDIQQLCAGACDAIATTLNTHDSLAALNAAILFKQHSHTIHIYDTFVFSPALEFFGKWYRQLYAESLGKDEKRGLVPTVSVGSTDLHSIGQLYLGGPKTVFTSFVTVNKQTNITTSANTEFETLVPNIHNKKLVTIMEAIIQGTQIAYQKSKRPFVTITLPKLNAYHIGQLLQYKMLEVMYLGILLEVNPFDQPHVELYKKETRKILAS